MPCNSGGKRVLKLKVKDRVYGFLPGHERSGQRLWRALEKPSPELAGLGFLFKVIWT